VCERERERKRERERERERENVCEYACVHPCSARGYLHVVFSSSDITVTTGIYSQSLRPGFLEFWCQCVTVCGLFNGLFFKLNGPPERQAPYVTVTVMQDFQI